MNQTVKSDDELLALLERTMSDVARLAPDMSLDAYRHDHRWMATAAATLIVVAGVAAAGVAISNREDPSPIDPGAQPTASTPIDTTPSPATLGPAATGPSPAITLQTIPQDFPADVPRPDTFDSMTIMTTDNERVGWEFLDHGQPTTSVERCTEYAASFDSSWTSTPKTDEAPSVLYARFLTNTEWRVGIYCTVAGDYLVQVMPA